MDDAILARELEDLRQQEKEGELDAADHARLREQLILRAAAEESLTTPRSTSASPWRWGLAVVVIAGLLSAALLPAVRERGAGAGITGNDAIDADASALAAQQWRAADRAAEAGRLPDAIRGYRQAVAVLPQRPDLRIRLGLALAESGRMPEAISQLRVAVRADPRLPITRIYLGALLTRVGRREEAARQWRQYLRLNPSGESADVVRRSLRRLKSAEDP